MPGALNDMGFYGVVVPAKSMKRVDLVGNEEEDGMTRVYLHISNVALGPDPADGVHCLKIATSEGEYVLATLDKAHCYQHRLEIVVDEGVTFSNSGPSALHVTGYQTVSYPQDDDSEGFDDDEGEDDADDDDDDEPAPRAVPLSNRRAIAQGPATQQQEDDEDDEDEEDEDYDEDEDEGDEEDGAAAHKSIVELLGKRLAYFEGPPAQRGGNEDKDADDEDEDEDGEDEGMDEDEDDEGEDGDLDLEDLEFGSDDFVGEAVDDEGEDDDEDDEDEEMAEPSPPKKADSKKRVAATPAVTPSAATPVAKKAKAQAPPASAPAKAQGKEAKAAAKAGGAPAAAAKANGTPAAPPKAAAVPPATAPVKSKDAAKAGKAAASAEAPKPGQKGGAVKEPSDEKAYERELVSFIKESGGTAKLTAVGQAIRKPPQVTKLTAYLNSKPTVFKYDATTQEVKLAQ